MAYYRDLSQWGEDYPEEAQIMMELEGIPDDQLHARLIELGWIEFEEDDEYKVVKDQANPLWHMHVKAVEESVGELVAQGIVEPYAVNEDGEIVYRKVEGIDDGGA